MNTNAHDLSSSKLDWPQKESVMAKTGKEIVDNWHFQPEKTSFTDLEKRIDEALQEARLEGELVGWKKAKEMVENGGRDGKLHNTSE